MANVLVAVSANPTSSETLVTELAVLLAGDGDTDPQLIDAAVLADRPQRQLLEAARLMGLTTVSRLKKDALVQRLWQAWQDLLARALGGGNGATAKGRDPIADGTAAGKPAAARGTKGEGEPAGPSDEGEPVAPVAHKFEVHPSAAATRISSVPADIPWGYAKDRVTAMPVDPDRLFVYWEVTEDALERARKTLGDAAEGAWLNLRIYDTTGRIFDGWNAHAIIDQGIDRGARQWFFNIGKPSSEAIVEIGLLARDGGFAKIARSGRVEFPRRDPVAWTEPEWLTVRLADGQVRRGWMPRPGKSSEAGGEAAGAAPGGGGAGLPVALPSPDVVVQVEEGERVVHRTEWHSEWEEVKSDDYVTAEGRVSWEEQGQISSWSEGPFPYPVEVPEPVRETSLGRTRVFRSGARTHVVYGPWQVVIHGLGATRSRSVISRWEVYRSWGEEGGRHVVHAQSGTGSVDGKGTGLPGASERLMRGASERVWRGASELRLGGSSELYYLGASELRLAGASERMYQGASERLLRGASERRLSGEAEWARRGASEGRLGGEAEWAGRGGSEGRLGGSSDFAPRAPASASDYPRPPVADDAKRDG